MSNLFFLNNSGNTNCFPQSNVYEPFIPSQNISNIPLFPAYHIYNNINNINSFINLDAINEKNFLDCHNDNKIKKIIQCPECGKICLAKQNNYIINIQCICGYNESSTIKEFDEKQKVIIKKLNCQSCWNEKSKYSCIECKSNFCQNCADNHKPDLNHNLIPIIQHEDNCLEHNERYISYCDNCKKDLCLLCEYEHKTKGHHTSNYILNIKYNKKKLDDSQKIKNQCIAIFNNFINELIEIIRNIIRSFNIIYAYKNNFGQFRTFDTLESIKSFNIDIFNKDFDKIIKNAEEKNIIKTFHSIIQLSNNIELKKPILYNKKYNKEIQVIKKEIEKKNLKNISYSNNKNEIMKIMQLPINEQINKKEVFIEKDLPNQYNYYPVVKNNSYLKENLRNIISDYEKSIVNKNSYINRYFKFEDCLPLLYTYNLTNSITEKINAIFNCYKNFMNLEKTHENKNINLPKLICAQDINYNEQYEQKDNEQYEQKENALIRVENDKHNENINKIDIEENIREKNEEKIEERIEEIIKENSEENIEKQLEENIEENREDNIEEIIEEIIEEKKEEKREENIEEYGNLIIDQSQDIIDRNTNSDFIGYINEASDKKLKTDQNVNESFSSDCLEVPNNDENEQISNINVNNISAIQNQSSVMNDSGIVIGCEVLKENYRKHQNSHHIISLKQCNIYLDENTSKFLNKNVCPFMKHIFKTPNLISNSWSRLIRFFSYWKRKFLKFIVKEKQDKNECNIVSQNNFKSNMFDIWRKYIVKNELILSFFDNDKENKNECFFSNNKNINEEISLLNKNEIIENSVHRIINVTQVKKIYYAPELFNFIFLNIITNPNSEFLFFYYNGIKTKLHLISFYNLKEIVYIIFTFDLIVLNKGKNQRVILKLALPYVYLFKKILHRCRYKIGANLIPFK